MLHNARCSEAASSLMLGANHPLTPATCFLPHSCAAAAADELKQIREKLEEKYQAVRP